PDDAAGGIPDQKLPPVHAADAGQPGGRDAQERDEAAEEDGLAPVFLEEPLGGRQRLLEMAARDRPAEEQPAAARAAEPVADVVADDRAGRRDHDHPEERVVALV